MHAIMHQPSLYLEKCQRTYVEHAAIDFGRACRQHEDYCCALAAAGATVQTLNVNCDLPDSVFVEDTAIVLDEIAILASMGAESRRAEPVGMERELRKYRDVQRIEAPARIEGGDVLRVGRTLFVGLSSRTNAAGVNALDALVRRFGYRVTAVPVRGCLHLKTACTALPDRTLLVNPAWLDVQALHGYARLCVPDEEPWAANVALVGDVVCTAADHVRTADLIRKRGFYVTTVDISEFAKAEGGVTCLSILF